MGELVIQYHNFENAKKEIKTFSEQTTTDLDLMRVDSTKGRDEFLLDCILGRGIGLNHNVTGSELNNLTSQIQTHLHSINNTQIKLIKEFGQVYSALEALDRDYIQAILVSIKATEETSQSIQVTQGQIKKIVENQRKTLEELKKFKQKLDGYSHLGDIDKIWNDFQKWHREINTLSQSLGAAETSSQANTKKIDAIKTTLTAAERKIADLFKQNNALTEKLESIITFTSAIEQITHLYEIDEMWESLSSAHNRIQNISGEIVSVREILAKHQESIDHLLVFEEKLSTLKHLMDVDDIWIRTGDCECRLKKIDDICEEHKRKLEEIEQRNADLQKDISMNRNELEQLEEYKTKLVSIVHLEEVDDIWDNVKAHSEQVSSLERQNADIVSIVKDNKESAERELANAVQEANVSIAALTQKIKNAYLIAGGAAGLAMIELIVLLIKVM